jgi:predicted enzyme related to lactoylglutathione lyase
MKHLMVKIGLLLLLSMSIAGNATAEKRMVSVVVPPINQPATGQYYPGKFIWHDLFTDKLEDSVDFYQGMFGWEFRKFGPGKRAYYYITSNGLGVGGLSQQDTNDGAENQWVSYISVDNVDAASSYVEQNGGKVLVSPRIFHQIGDVAIFADPEGAPFGVINSLSEVFPHVGNWIWSDLFALNPKAQTEFYKGLADYNVVNNSASAITGDYFLHSNNVARGGVVLLPAEDIIPNWLPYVRITDINDSIVKVTQLGGQVLLQPSMWIHSSKLAIISDPGGAALGIIEIGQQ